MIIVTGGAGFIGSNIVAALNQQGYRDILVVDNLTDGKKFANLADLDIADYLDKTDFLDRLAQDHHFGAIEAIFHQGACSSTTEWNGRYMMENNYQYSKTLLHYSVKRKIPFLYASSAATYGGRDHHFIEQRQYEQPLNVYGYSKFLFDEYVRRLLPSVTSPICGFRYFNVYGPREYHKGNMASVAYHLYQQLENGENPKLFAGSEHFKRDFVYVGDVAAMNLWFWQQQKSGIYNCGSGRAESFQAIADAVIAYYQRGQVETIPFPEQLKGRYQTFTEADLSQVRQAGYQANFKTVAQGVNEYLHILHHTNKNN